MSDPETPDIAPAARRALQAALYECKRVIVGQDAMLERVLVALLTGGHVLLEGVPGLAKTLTVRTLAQVLGGTFSRVQFTPDLVPWHPTLGDVDSPQALADYQAAKRAHKAQWSAGPSRVS